MRFTIVCQVQILPVKLMVGCSSADTGCICWGEWLKYGITWQAPKIGHCVEEVVTVAEEQLSGVTGAIDTLDHLFDNFCMLFPKTSCSINCLLVEFRLEQCSALGGAALKQMDISNEFVPGPPLTAANIFGDHKDSSSGEEEEEGC
jgi:hypothetical protein